MGQFLSLLMDLGGAAELSELIKLII
jgi:hypothetical protein